jgi:hypothetical protein
MGFKEDKLSEKISVLQWDYFTNFGASKYKFIYAYKLLYQK